MTYPFYIETRISGRSTPIKGGTKSKKGYMETFIYQRDKGKITNPFKIIQRSVEEFDEQTQKYKQVLHTEVYYKGKLIKTHTTDY